jgi:hypothetical protein
LGLLGIQFDTRRRNRVNGEVDALLEPGFSLHVEQSFGNCPKYIHRRRSSFVEPAPDERRTVTREGPLLSSRAQQIIEAADTFFIASMSPREPGTDDHARGADVSHRGGAPGFVHLETVAGAHVLVIPDYSGNYFFNTLGNLALHPRAGVLFVNFVDGTLLLLTGSTEIILEGPEVEREPAAERVLRLRVSEGRLLESALDLRFRPSR